MNTVSFSQGETSLLDSSKDEEGRDYGYTAGFDWSGGMEATLVSSTVYQSFEDYGIKETELLSPQRESSLFLVCRLRLKNIDAVLDSSYTNPRSDIKGFDINVFSLQAAQESLRIAYFKGAIEDTGKGHYTLYELAKGEEKEFSIGYFISPSDLDKNMYYKVGISATCMKYIFFINPEIIN